MDNFTTLNRIKLVLIILISIVTITFTVSQLKSENWSETYPTPDGRCGKVCDYVLNKVKTASAYASVKKRQVTHVNACLFY